MPQQSKSTSFQSPWLRRSFDLPSEEKTIAREITPEDIEYLRKYKFPFLRIGDASASPSPSESLVIIKGPKGGWPIRDQGNLISAAPHWMHLTDAAILDEEQKEAEKPSVKAVPEKKDREEGEADQEGGEGAGELSLNEEAGKGTIVNQTVMTAFDMVTMALAKGWDAIKVIDGSELMQWAAWAAAQDAGLKVYGFAPSEREKAKYERLRGIPIQSGRVSKPGVGL